MSDRDINYYLDNPTEFDALTEEQQIQLANNGFLTESEQASPDSDEEVTGEATHHENAGDQEGEQEEPVIMQKSGKGTIPYSALEDARKQAQQWRELAEQKEALLSQMQAAKQQDMDEGGTANQQAVSAEYESMFPEVAEDLKPLIQKMIQDGIKSGIEQFTAAIDSRVQPVEQQFYEQLSQQNDDAILKTHPDFVEFTHNPKFAEFVKNNPFIIDSQTKLPMNTAQVWDNFRANEINELVRQAKEYAGMSAATQQRQASDETTRLVSQKMKAANSRTPTTFSDIPAGVKDAVSEDDKISSMSPKELETYMLNMTEAQRNALFARLA